MIRWIAGWLARQAAQRPWRSIGLAGLALAVGIAAAWNLPVRASLIDLLPEDHPAVKDLEEVSRRLGGFGFLLVAAESESPEAARRFLSDFSARARRLPEVRYVDYRIRKEFFEDRKLLYVSLEDLREIRGRIERKIEYERQRLNPLALNLRGGNGPVELDFTDIERKYASLERRSDYYQSEDGRLCVALVKPVRPAADVEFSRRLIEKVEAEVRALRPSRYHPSLKVTLAGRYRDNLVHTETLQQDIRRAGLGALAAILVLCAAAYRSLRAGFLLLLPAAVSLACAYAFARGALGHLNLITGFLAAVLLGLSVEYGIFYLTRFQEERRKGSAVPMALWITATRTAHPLAASAATTAAAFYSLTFSTFKGFSEFGILAGTGVLFNFLATFSVLPALISLTERWRPAPARVPMAPRKHPEQSLPHWRAMVWAGILLTLFFGLYARRSSFQYSFRELGSRRRDLADLEDRINRIFRTSLTPTPILVPDLAAAEAAVQALKQRMTRPDTTIQEVASIYIYLPRSQEAHLEEIRQIRDLLGRTKIRLKEGPLKRQMDTLRRLAAVDRPVRIEDLPEEVIRQFTDTDGERGRIVYVFPRIDLSDAKAVMKFAGEIREIRYDPQKPPVRGVGEEVIFATIVDLIRRQGLWAVSTTFLAVFVIVWIQFRKFGRALLCMVPLWIGFLWIFGILAAAGLRWNFLSVVMIPSLIGMGVDFGINFYQRYREEGYGRIGLAVRTTGFSMGLSALCLMAAFAMLMLADYRGLNTIGQVAVVGIASIYLVSIFFFPALLQAVEFVRRIGAYAPNSPHAPESAWAARAEIH